MALIKCPECGKEISSKSTACIHCGYPISNSEIEPKPLFDVVVNDFQGGISKYNKIFKMTKEISDNLFKFGDFEDNSQKHSIIIAPSGITYADIEKHLYKSPNELKDTPFVAFSKLSPESAKWISDLMCKYGASVDIIESSNDNVEPDTMINTAITKMLASDKPKCPTCGSTNISKISDTAKVAGALAFGLLSKTAKSQFKCNNCGYKW